MTVKVDAISGSARKKIEEAGGTVEVLPRIVHRPKFIGKDGQDSRKTSRKNDEAVAAATAGSAEGAEEQS